MPKDCNSSKLDRIELTYSTAPPNGTQHQVPHQLVIGSGFTRINSYFGLLYFENSMVLYVLVLMHFNRLIELKSVITSISSTYLLPDPSLVPVPF